MGMADHTSRINGAKSKGPITPEGKARSAANSLRHGLCSEQVVLPHEDRSLFEELRASYIERFQPADQPEADLVETLASARWRLNRLVAIENKIFEKEMVFRDPDMTRQLRNMTQVEKLAWTFDHLANNGKSLQLLIRYEGSLNRTYERALKQLQLLQSTRPPAPPAEVRNEPSPILLSPHVPPKNEPDPPSTAPAEAPAASETPSGGSPTEE